MARKAPEYVALSTINAQTNGWTVYARGNDRSSVEDEGYQAIDAQYPNRLDIYSDTLRKNYRVVSLTDARRLAGRCQLRECDHDHEL